MPSASSDQSHQNSALARKISKIGEPRFDVFDKWKRTGRSQLDTAEEELPPGTLTIPKQIQDHENIQLKGEGFAAEWMSSNVREDVTLVRIPAWAVEGVTTCIFPNVVVQTWPKTEYIPINRDDASCLRVADIREKGKGCLATRAAPDATHSHVPSTIRKRRDKHNATKSARCIFRAAQLQVSGFG